MKIRQLRYLTAVVEAGSITEGARRLNVSQPALSAGLAALDQRRLMPPYQAAPFAVGARAMSGVRATSASSQSRKAATTGRRRAVSVATR